MVYNDASVAREGRKRKRERERERERGEKKDRLRGNPQWLRSSLLGGPLKNYRGEGGWLCDCIDINEQRIA